MVAKVLFLGVVGFSFNCNIYAQAFRNINIFLDNGNRVTEIQKSDCSYIEYKYDKDGNRSEMKKIFVKVNAKITDATCGISNGSIILNSINPNSNYSYNWSSGGAGKTIINQPADTYTVTITDLNNTNNYSCIQTFSIKQTGQSIPTPTITPLGNRTFCIGDSVKLKSSTGVGYFYQWHKDGNPIQNARDSFYWASMDGLYSVLVTKDSCSLSSDTFRVKVNSLPQVTASASSTFICPGTSTTLSGGGANSYKWSHGVVDRTSFIPASTTTYTVTGTDTNGCPNTSNITITVYPTPNVADPLDLKFCNEENTTAIAFNGSIPGTTFSWTNNNTSIGLPAVGNGTIQSFKAINTGSSPITATITVVPSANSCIGTSQVFTITVNPTPSLFNLVNQTVCNGEQINTITFNGSVNGTSYSWTNDNTSIGLALNGNGIIPSFVAKNAGIQPITAVIKVTPSANACSGLAQSFMITINPTPNVILPSNQSICTGQNTLAVSFNGSVNGTTYSWSNNNISIGLASNGNGNIPPFKTINNGIAPVTALITVVPTVNGCLGLPQQYKITVNPLPIIKATSSATSICKGSSVILSGSGGAVYSWSDQVLDGVPFIPKITTTYTVTGTDSNGCVNTSSTKLTVNDLPIPVIETNNQPTTFCFGDSIKLTCSLFGIKYKWNTNDTTQSVVIKGTGYYTVEVIDSNGCKGISSPPLSIKTLSNPKPVIETDKSLPICNGDTVVLSSSSQGINYLWNNGEQTQSISTSKTGIYFVKVSYANGCSSSSMSLQVKVNALPVVEAGPDSVYLLKGNSILIGGTPTASGKPPFTYKWNPLSGLDFADIANPLASPTSTTVYLVNVKDGNNCSSIDSITVIVEPVTGVDQLSDKIELLVFPNPTNNSIQITSPTILNGSYYLKFINSNGQIVLKEELKILNSPLNKEISLTGFASGTYIILLENEKLKYRNTFQKID